MRTEKPKMLHKADDYGEVIAYIVGAILGGLVVYAISQWGWQ